MTEKMPNLKADKPSEIWGPRKEVSLPSEKISENRHDPDNHRLSKADLKNDNLGVGKERTEFSSEPIPLVSDIDYKEKEAFESVLRVIETYQSTELRNPTQIELSEALDCAQSTMSNLLRKMRRKRVLDQSMRIIGKFYTQISATQTRRIPFRLEDGSYSGTDRIPVSMLLGSERGAFKFFSWLVEDGDISPDIIERGVRADDLAIFRIQESAEPGDIVLIKKPDPDPEKAPRLVLAVATEKTRFVLGKVVSVMREEITNGDDQSS